MTDGPPNFHQLFNESRGFDFRLSAQFQRTVGKLDKSVGVSIAREISQLAIQWNEEAYALPHFQARWTLKPVRGAEEFKSILVLECYVANRKFRVFLTIDVPSRSVWVLDIWQKSGSTREQAKVIESAFARANELLNSEDER